MTIEIINKDGLFGSLTSNYFAEVALIDELKAKKEALHLSKSDAQIFDQIITSLEALPRKKAKWMPKRISQQPVLKPGEDPKNWSYQHQTRQEQEIPILYWNSVDKFFTIRRELNDEAIDEQVWDHILFLNQYKNKLKIWASACDILLHENAFSGANKLKNERETWRIERENLVDKFIQAKSYVVYTSQGYLDFQACGGSLSNARLFESPKAIELAGKKNQTWNSGHIVEIEMKVHHVISHSPQTQKHFDEIQAYLEKSTLINALDDESKHQHQDKINLLLERLAQTQPELLEELGLQTQSSIVKQILKKRI